MFDTKNLVKKFSDKVSGKEDENYDQNIDVFNERMKDWPFKSSDSTEVNSDQNAKTQLAVEEFLQQETGVFDLDQLERESMNRSVNVANEPSGLKSLTGSESFKKLHIEITRNYFLCEKIIDELKEIRQNAEKYGQEFDVLDYIKSLETIYSTKFKSLFNSIYEIKNL